MNNRAEADAAHVAGYDQRQAEAVDALRGATSYVLITEDGNEIVGVNAAFLHPVSAQTANFLAAATKGVTEVWRRLISDPSGQHDQGESE